MWLCALLDMIDSSRLSGLHSFMYASGVSHQTMGELYGQRKLVIVQVITIMSYIP